MRAKILSASAGSGKTYQLVYKYIRDVVENPSLYRHILAVTFTNKATEEMKSRILRQVDALASGGKSPYLEDLMQELSIDEKTVRERSKQARTLILHDYSRFTVLTIDTFFQRILRAFIKELGIDLNYNVEIETSSLLIKGVDSLIEQIAEDEPLKRWMVEFAAERMEESKRWDLREAILDVGGEIFKESNRAILSDAKSKESIAKAIKSLAQRASATKVQMKRTAQEAIEIIAREGLSVDDFPYKKGGFAAYFYTTASGECVPYKSRVSSALQSEEAWGKIGSASRNMAPKIKGHLENICSIYDSNHALWNTAALLGENYRSFALLADLYSKVERMCEEQNLMLLSETKHILSEFIKDSDTPFIYEKVGNRYERYMIDEFQDTSKKEWQNFLPLLQNAISQAESTSVFIVGDVKQSIYRWRGGDWRILHNEALSALGAENTELVNLKDNWRSLPRVVEFNNNLISSVVRIDNSALNGSLSEAVERGGLSQESCGELHNMMQSAYREHSQVAKRKSEAEGYICIERYDEEPPIITTICSLIDRGFRPCDILVLVRTKAEGARVANAILAFKRDVESQKYRFDVMTQEALIVGSAPISGFIIATLRLSINSDDTLSRAIYNQYLGRDFACEIDPESLQRIKNLAMLSPEEAFEQILIWHSLQDRSEEIAYIQALHEQIISFCSTRIADISLFVEWWDEVGCNRSLSVERSEHTVEIMTIHKAKGLEKAAVIMPFTSWRLDPKPNGSIVWAEGDDLEDLGRFPIKYKKSMEQSAFSLDFHRERLYSHIDNINLLYVALTRASESLHIFVPQRGGDNVGELIFSAIERRDEGLFIGDCSLNDASEGGVERYTVGEPTPHIVEMVESSAKQIVMRQYPTSEIMVRLSLPSQRYFEEQEVELSPQNFGLLMHKAFEGAESREQIFEAVNQMQQRGTISAEHTHLLRSKIEQSLDNPIVAEWFNGRWQSVKSEAQIVIPASQTQRRPDRVMIDGERVVVVDYKFGKRNLKAHSKQVRDYLSLLQRMGYSSCEGYIWYVNDATVEPVMAE